MRTRSYYPEFEMDLQLQSPDFLQLSTNFTEQTGIISIWLEVIGLGITQFQTKTKVECRIIPNESVQIGGLNTRFDVYLCLQIHSPCTIIDLVIL